MRIVWERARAGVYLRLYSISYEIGKYVHGLVWWKQFDSVPVFIHWWFLWVMIMNILVKMGKFALRTKLISQFSVDKGSLNTTTWLILIITLVASADVRIPLVVCKVSLPYFLRVFGSTTRVTRVTPTTRTSLPNTKNQRKCCPS